MVTLAIVSVVMAAVYIVYAASARSYTTQDVAAGVQQSIRVGMEFMVRDIRMAGFAPEPGALFGIEVAEGSKIRFTMDTVDTSLTPPDYNGSIDDIGAERITYQLDAGNRQLLRVLDEGTAMQTDQVLLDHVNAVAFQYVDQDQNTIAMPVAAADLENIRGVEIELTIQEPAGRGEPVIRTLTQRVVCRNMGL